jgi:hypothetical protein
MTTESDKAEGKSVPRSDSTSATLRKIAGERAAGTFLLMRRRRRLLTALIPFLLSAKTDPYQQVAPPDRLAVKEGVERYARDQLKRNWSDLFELKIPSYAIRTDHDDVSSKAPFLTKQQFTDEMENAVKSGSHPVMQSFDLISVAPVDGGYEVRACSKAQRESFHFKGIVEFTAYVSNRQVHFGSWRFVHSMPHSCSQTADSQ